MGSGWYENHARIGGLFVGTIQEPYGPLFIHGFPYSSTPPSATNPLGFTLSWAYEEGASAGSIGGGLGNA